MLTSGDPAPWFRARSSVNPRFVFDTVGGRHVVLCLFGSAASPEVQALLRGFDERSHVFDGENAVFFGVSTDPEDERLGRVPMNSPHMIYFWDFDQAISRTYGAAPDDSLEFHPHLLVLDPTMRVLTALPLVGDPQRLAEQVVELLGRLPPMAAHDAFAPVTVVPRIFEPEFCRMLIGLYEQHGGRESGFMRDEGGKTIEVTDYSHKRRSDYDIADQDVIRQCQMRLHRRLVPELKKVFQFTATRIERHIVACYDAESGGHFRRHRDNTTRGTAHRRFAVSINLNSEEFEGGNLWFPEYGLRQYRPPTGGAVVFSCSLLHEATPVIAGKRYAFLPFLYDEEGAQIRQRNAQYLA